MGEHPVTFELSPSGVDRETDARAGVLHTPHGDVETPAFMPVGTQGTVKMLTSRQVRAAGARALLANTYHLMLRPGEDAVAEVGGLHRFMAWDGPILTDSGGFQVYSLARLNKITDEGVHFQSHVDGESILLTPRRSMDVQMALGADIALAFDDCPPYPWEPADLAASVERTICWAERSRRAHTKNDQALFGIVQGGVDPELRRRCAEALVALDFAGYAIGGVSVGEGPQLLRAGIRASVPYLPEGKIRYLMGVGPPEDMLDAIAAGIDLFDCVIPTRNARGACAFTFAGKVRLKNAVHARDERPLEAGCACETCQNYTRAALRHWYLAGEVTASILVSLHNIHMFTTLMQRARNAILAGEFAAFREKFLRDSARGRKQEH